MEEKTAKGTAIINKGEEREEDRSGGSGASILTRRMRRIRMTTEAATVSHM